MKGREIKFRIWDENLGMCKEPIIGGNKPVQVNKALNEMAIGVVMQYTGLKNKNGVEIYEGDVLENPQGKRGVVKFEDGRFIIESKRNKDTIWFIPLDAGFVKNKVIVGNIYENPELLEI